jgi:CBS domain-containing protein
MRDIFVGRLMSTPVTTVTPETAAREAARRMLEESVGSLVVTDCGDPVGILTTTDFVDVVASGDTAKTTVEDHMCTDVVTTSVNEPVPAVAETMMDESIHHLPVADDTAGVVGMITTTDLTAYLSGIAVGDDRRAIA